MVARIPLAWPGTAAAVFGMLLLVTAGGWGPLDAVDTTVSEWFRRIGSARPGLIAVVRVATDVAATWAYVLAGVIAAGVLFARSQRGAARFVAAVTAAVPACWGLMHWWVPHPRPMAGFVTVLSYGFPSGHTANATAMALSAVLLLWPRLSRAGRVWAVAAAATFALAVGLSRVVLLAHWPADVVGGWLLALAVVPPLAWLVPRSPPLAPTSSGPVPGAP